MLEEEGAEDVEDIESILDKHARQSQINNGPGKSNNSTRG